MSRNIEASISFDKSGRVSATVTENIQNKETRKYPGYDELIKSLGRQRFWNTMGLMTGLSGVGGGILIELVSCGKFFNEQGIHLYSQGDAVVDQLFKIGIIAGGYMLLRKTVNDADKLQSLENKKKEIVFRTPTLAGVK